MKKLIILLMTVFALTFVFSACDGESFYYGDNKPGMKVGEVTSAIDQTSSEPEISSEDPDTIVGKYSPEGFLIINENGGMAEDKVLIFTLTKWETRKFLTYTVEDFADINAVKLEELTINTVDWVRKKLAGEPVDGNMAIDIDNYKRMFAVTIAEPGLKALQRAKELLEKREGVLSVDYNVVFTIDWVELRDILRK